MGSLLLANGLIRVCSTLFWVPYRAWPTQGLSNIWFLSFMWLPAYGLGLLSARLLYIPEIMHLFSWSTLWHWDKQAVFCVPA